MSDASLGGAHRRRERAVHSATPAAIATIAIPTAHHTATGVPAPFDPPVVGGGAAPVTVRLTLALATPPLRSVTTARTWDVPEVLGVHERTVVLRERHGTGRS